MFVMKIFLLIIGVLVILFIAPLFTTLPGAKILLPIVALVLAFDTMREFFFSLIRAMENMQWEAAIFLLTNLGIVVFGFIFLYYAANAQSFTWGYVAGDAVGTIVGHDRLAQLFQKNILPFFAAARHADPQGRVAVRDQRRARPPFYEQRHPHHQLDALGVGGGHLFRRHPHHSDVLSDPKHHPAGHASRHLAPREDGQSALPELVRTDARHGISRFRPAIARGDRARHADHDLRFRRPLRGGRASFKLLSATLFFDFAAAIVINALFAYEHQKSLIVSSALGGVVNVGLDLALIPFFGMAGSAVATLIAQAVNNGYLWYAMKKVNPFTVMGSLKKIFLRGIVMAIGERGLHACSA